MPAFLDLAQGEQTRILKELKGKLDVTWDEMAKLLEVNHGMVFQYLRESSRLPLRRVQLMCKKRNLPFSEYASLKTMEFAYSGLKEPYEPELDERLAEFLGALGGDGCVCETKNAISITCSAVVDSHYVNGRIRNLFESLFKLPAKVYTEDTRIQCRIYSKKLKEFLSEKHNFPIGNRKNRMRIQREIKQSQKLLRCYLRGLFDTDGSFHRRRENSGVVEYISCSPLFLKDIKNALKTLGFSASLSGKSVYIYNQKQVDKFFKTIKPKNLKHITKYKIFKETGRVPVHREIIELMRSSSSG